MTDIAQRIAGLSPEKRALLEARLAQQSAQRTGVSKPIECRADDAPLVPSFGQERLWFLEQIEGGTALYNISEALRLRGSLHLNALARAIGAIIARHETLRTRYVSVGGALALEVVEPGELPELPLPVIDTTEEDLDAALKSEAGRPIALDRDLAMRAVVLRLDERDHVLQITMHHVASDGWSLGVLMRELTTLYNAEVAGAGVELPTLPIRYSDYAHWMRETLRGPELERLTSYWADHLAGSPFALQLPTDHARPVKQTFSGKESFFSLSPETTRALREFCACENATPFMVLLAAFYAVLGRYTGQSNVLVGTPIAARTRPEMEGLIGFFTNTLVMRGDLSGEPTFQEFVQRVKRAALGAYAHQDIPFEKLIEELKPERDLSRSPVFQVMFVLQNAPSSGIELEGLDVSRHGVHSGTAKFDLTVAMAETERGLDAWIEYNTALFESATIDRLWTHFNAFLVNALRQPGERVAAIPLLTVAEEKQLLNEWNATAADYASDTPLAQLIEQQVERTPDQVALSFDGRDVTYRELNDRANVLAHELVARGAGPDALVGVCLERSVEMVIALLAIVKSGGAYVPLDPGFPRDRLAYMAQDAALTVLVTERELEDMVPSYSGEIVYVGDYTAANRGATNPDIVVSPDDLAYVIYTSGTTGKPKGVQVPRGAFVNFLLSMRERPGISERDVLLAVTTISFDIAGLELFLPLVTGARIVLASRETAADGAALRSLLEQSGATMMQATPITWRLLFEAGWTGDGRLKALCGGEAMPPDLIEPLAAASGAVWNMYGPTETTVWSSVYRVESGDEAVLIGRPIGNTTMYILDANRALLPVGVTGELYIAGDGVARDYRNRPELTAEKFVADPFHPGRRMYRTGDLARFHADGNIECLGRTDDQVKIRGFRIELGEIESRVQQYEGVAQAVVIAREDTPGDKRLVGYIVAEAGGGGDGIAVADLRKFLKQSLPDYMVPAAFVTLKSLPLTANGKIDRKALPAPDAGTVVTERKIIRPRSYVENQLTEVWEDIFAVADLSVEDDFFDLGGHSLLALRMMARVTQVFGKHVPLNTLFEAPTIAQLARHIEDAERTDGQHTLVSVQASGTRPPIFWIPGGAALGLLSLRHVVTRLGPEQPVYGLGSNYPKSLSEIETVEERASHYLELVRKFRPHGPYCFAGFCAGGKVALEMAQQLTADGEDVPFLGLINCWFPSWPPTRMDRLRLKSERLRYQIREARAHGVGLAGYVRTKMADRHQAQLARLAVEAMAGEVKERGFQDADETQNLVLLNAVVEAFERYHVRDYHGHVSLFISRDDEELAGVSQNLDPRFAWTRHADSHDIRTFPGGHVGVVEMPYAIDFAESFKAALDLALEKTVSDDSCAIVA